MSHQTGTQTERLSRLPGEKTLYLFVTHSVAFREAVRFAQFYKNEVRKTAKR